MRNDLFQDSGQRWEQQLELKINTPCESKHTTATGNQHTISNKAHYRHTKLTHTPTATQNQHTGLRFTLGKLLARRGSDKAKWGHPTNFQVAQVSRPDASFVQCVHVCVYMCVCATVCELSHDHTPYFTPPLRQCQKSGYCNISNRYIYTDTDILKTFFPLIQSWWMHKSVLDQINFRTWLSRDKLR